MFPQGEKRNNLLYYSKECLNTLDNSMLKNLSNKYHLKKKNSREGKKDVISMIGKIQIIQNPCSRIFFYIINYLPFNMKR